MGGVVGVGVLGVVGFGWGGAPAAGQATPQPADSRFSPHELVDTGHKFFGGVSRGLAQIIERAVSQWGLPNGYVLGQEAGGAFIGGPRFREGTMSAQKAGEFWVSLQGAARGLGIRGGSGRTMRLGDHPPPA